MAIQPIQINPVKSLTSSLGEIMQMQRFAEFQRQNQQKQQLDQQKQQFQQNLSAFGTGQVQQPEFLKRAFEIDPVQALKYQQQFQKMDTKKTTHLMERANNLMSAVQNQDEYDIILRKLQSEGMDTSSYPANFNPKHHEFMLRQGLNVEDNLKRAEIQQKMKFAKTSEERAKLMYDFNIKEKEDELNRLTKGMVPRHMIAAEETP